MAGVNTTQINLSDDTIARITAARGEEKNSARAHPPIEFDGSHENTDQFLYDCKNYIHLTTSLKTDKSKILWIAGYMNKGRAKDWTRTEVEALWDKESAYIASGDSEAEAIRKTWNYTAFIKRIHDTYIPVNAKEHASLQLQKLKQRKAKNGLQDYVVQFEHLAAKAGYNANTHANLLRDYLKQGLDKDDR